MEQKTLTDRAQKVISFSIRKAGQTNGGRVLTEDILLGLANTPGIAQMFLKSLGLDKKTVRQKIVQKNSRPRRIILRAGVRTVDGKELARSVIGMAGDWSDKFHHQYIGTEHMLLAILPNGEEDKKEKSPTKAYKILADAGATVQKFLDDTGWSDLIQTH